MGYLQNLGGRRFAPAAPNCIRSALPRPQQAGENNALICTLLANCRARGLDPEDYLVEVLKRLPYDATVEQAAALTPARIAAERRARARARARAEEAA